jgi:hypothetical protein
VWKENRAPAGRKINFPFKRDISADKIEDEKGMGDAFMRCPFFFY